MARKDISGIKFFKINTGLYESESGLTAIIRGDRFGDGSKGWWAKDDKEGFIGVFKTLKAALRFKWR